MFSGGLAALRRSASGIVLVAAAGISAAPALAQEPPSEAQQEPRDVIVITGSLISGTPEDAALPVDVITSDDLVEQGGPSLLELVKSLPSVGAVIGESNQFSTSAQGVVGTSSVNLRGLGSQRTLVLLNGRRVSPTAETGAYGVDTNLLPLAAVGRVEILKDGAAATYGSDAIGGVVNFITRDDPDGFEAAADYKFIDGSDGDYSASLNWGWMGEQSNIFVSLAYQHRSELSTRERDWTFQPYTRNPAGWSVLGQPGVFLPRNGATPTAGVTRDANCEAVGGYAGFAGATPACYFSYIPFTNLVEETDQYQAYGEINASLSETLEMRIEGLYAYTDIPDIRFSPSYPPTSGPSGPGSVNAFSVTSSGPAAFANNPGVLTALQQSGLSPAQIAATNAVSLTLWRPIGAGGNSATGGLGGQSGYRNYELLRVSAGLNGEIAPDLNFDVALTWSDTTHNRMTTDILTDRLQRALNGLGGAQCNGVPFGTPGSTCQTFNPFSNGYTGNPALGLSNPGYVPANGNSPGLVAWLFDRPNANQNQKQFTADVVVDGVLDLSLGVGDIGWAIGAQYRYERYQGSTDSAFNDPRITPCPQPGVTSCAFRTGPYIFLGQFFPNSLDASVWAVFGELAVPVSDSIDMQLAVRHEDYGGLTGATTNPKASLRWQATDALALRASVGTTFRGPTPNDRRTNGVTGLSSITAAGNNFKSVDFFGNPGVGPETAFTSNIGAIFEAGGLRAIVDYWRFDFEDQIVTVPANIVATAVAGTGNGSQAVNCASPLRPLITFSNNDTCVQGVTVGNDIARVRSDITNGSRVETSGLDLSLSYAFADPVAGGDLTVGIDASHVLEYRQDAFLYGGVTVSPAYDAVGFTNYDRFPGTISPWRATLFANYGRDALNVRYDAQFIDGVDDNRAPISVQASAASPLPGSLIPISFGRSLDAFISHNIHATYETDAGATLGLSIVNLLDEAPPAARLEYSYDPFIGNPLGRTIELSLRTRF
jgi:iron complex outermembrane receptor protein